MYFPFLSYIVPGWYFDHPDSIKSLGETTGVNPSRFDSRDEANAIYDSRYAAHADWLYRGLREGCIEFCKPETQRRKTFLPIDGYRFIRRFFGSKKALYVLGIRLFSSGSPIAEISGFVKSRNTPEYTWNVGHPARKGQSGESDMRDVGSIRVVIPTLNRPVLLKDLLADLENQTRKDFSVHVVDQSNAFDAAMYQLTGLDIVVHRQQTPGVWKARNSVVRETEEDVLVFLDDDSRIEPDWLDRHIHTLALYDADISAGVSISTTGGKTPADYRYFRLADQLDTGNVAIHRRVFREIGLFDLQFEGQRMGDAEFGLRALRAGFRSISNPLAKRIHLKASSGGLREQTGWDSYRPRRFWQPRPAPGSLYFLRRFFDNRTARRALLRFLPGSVTPYRLKGVKMARIAGATMGLFLSPFVAFQVARAWRISSRMRREGPRIDGI